MFFSPCMVIDSRQKSFVMNMHLRQCSARVKPFRLKKSQILSGFFWFPKKNNCVTKIQLFSKSDFQKAKLATLILINAFLNFTSRDFYIVLEISIIIRLESITLLYKFTDSTLMSIFFTHGARPSPTRTSMNQWWRQPAVKSYRKCKSVTCVESTVLRKLQLEIVNNTMVAQISFYCITLSYCFMATK